MKDFTQWHEQKEKVDSSFDRRYYQEREVWWCRIGLNVGNEQNGKGDNYERPVLVYKKFNSKIFLGLPLTSQVHEGKFYHEVMVANSPKGYAILSQIRLFDAKRLINRIGVVEKEHYSTIKKAVQSLLCD